MDRLVTIFAPRGRFDFLIKAICLLVFLGAMNWVRDIAANGALADPFWNNFMESAFVGIAPTILALALVGHLNKLQKSLKMAAVTDALTGLPNRRKFFEDVEGALPSPGGILLMIDADHFKRVNDTYGHGVGDQCLIEIADMLRQQMRNGDVVARLGGEEFGALLIGASPDEAREIGERLVEGVNVAIGAQSGGHHITMSIGAMSTAGQMNIAKLLSVADAALYEAKDAGRGRMVFADTGDTTLKKRTTGGLEVA